MCPNRANSPTVQYSTVQYNTIRYSTVSLGTIQYKTAQYSTVQYSTDLHLATAHTLVWCGTIRGVPTGGGEVMDQEDHVVSGRPRGMSL